MLATPIGRLMVTVDGQPVDYFAEKFRSDEFCPEVDGRYLIEIELPPDGQEHSVACRIENYSPVPLDEVESGNWLEEKSFYQGSVRLTLGMLPDAENMTGHRSVLRDYDREYLEDGLQYLTFSFTKTGSFAFGAAWLKENRQEITDQVRIAADPRNMRFLKEHPRWKNHLAQRQRDKLLSIRLEYCRSVAVERDGLWGYQEERTELLLLDRADLSMEYHLYTQGRDMSAFYHDVPQIQNLFVKMEELGFPKAQTTVIQDVLQNQERDCTYRITAIYAGEGRRVLSGRFDCYGIPEYFAEFVQQIYRIIGFPMVSDMLEEEIYSHIPSRRSDLKFCQIILPDRNMEQSFSYLCDQEEIVPGSWVLIPFGKDNRIEVGYVRSVSYAQPENAPYPIARTKRILRECTQADLAQKEEQDKDINIAYRAPDAHFSISSHNCPLLHRRIYWAGRGGCVDVMNACEECPEFMEHFDCAFDPDTAAEICEECGWREDE